MTKLNNLVIHFFIYASNIKCGGFFKKKNYIWWLYDMASMTNGLHLYTIKEEMTLTFVNPIVTPIQQLN